MTTEKISKNTTNAHEIILAHPVFNLMQWLANSPSGDEVARELTVQAAVEAAAPVAVVRVQTTGSAASADRANNATTIASFFMIDSPASETAFVGSSVDRLAAAHPA